MLAFDLRHSDLPLQVAFPLLWSNLVDWLAPDARSPIPTQVSPGQSLAFNAPEGTQNAAGEAAASVTRPDGSTTPLQAENGRFVFTDTTQPGDLPGEFPTRTGQPGRQRAPRFGAAA